MDNSLKIIKRLAIVKEPKHKLRFDWSTLEWIYIIQYLECSHDRLVLQVVFNKT